MTGLAIIGIGLIGGAYLLSRKESQDSNVVPPSPVPIPATPQLPSTGVETQPIPVTETPPPPPNTAKPITQPVSGYGGVTAPVATAPAPIDTKPVVTGYVLTEPVKTLSTQLATASKTTTTTKPTSLTSGLKTTYIW